MLQWVGNLQFDLDLVLDDMVGRDHVGPPHAGDRLAVHRDNRAGAQQIASTVDPHDAVEDMRV
jgi:hypothetical protein